MPVALEDLRRGRCGLEAQPLARNTFDLRVGRRVRAHRARQLSNPHTLEGAGEAQPVTVELEGPAGKLEPERGRFGVDTVRPPDLQRLTVLLGSRDHSCECTLETGEDQRT